jgi:hypothetical protein
MKIILTHARFLILANFGVFKHTRSEFIAYNLSQFNNVSAHKTGPTCLTRGDIFHRSEVCEFVCGGGGMSTSGVRSHMLFFVLPLTYKKLLHS